MHIHTHIGNYLKNERLSTLAQCKPNGVEDSKSNNEGS